jgi:peptidylamidoglycolate lyase
MSGCCSRRALLVKGAAAFTAAAAASAPNRANAATVPANCGSGDGEILGQGNFRYRAHRFWGRLDHVKYPVKDCHGICCDRNGRVVLLTNDTHNNLIAYTAGGGLLRAWENRFRGAHGFDIVDHQGEDLYWITDHTRRLVSVCTPEGRELLHVGPAAVRTKYADLSNYRPTNTATMPDGDFYVSDGYGSSFVHHFDPKGRYISSFGGKGDAPEKLNIPHAVWIDRRSGKPLLLICDRGHNALKWFSLSGEFLRSIDLGAAEIDDEPIGAFPCNVAQFHGYRDGQFDDHLAIACLYGMVLILDGTDRVVSVIGGMPPVYVDGKLQQLQNYNYTFEHPHDLDVDASGAIYVAQWGSNRTYPIKLEPL